MSNLDIADLLRRALLARGCTKEQVGNFDGHSTIELELDNLPNLNVERVDDDVWLWSPVDECNEAMLRHCAADLLQLLMRGFSHARTGQLQLADVQGRLELRVMLGSEALTGEEPFADALDAFLDSVQTLQGIVRQ
jgi:hypothetical protein